MKKYVAYYRQSTQKQALSNLGLSAQKTMVNNHIKNNEGELTISRDDNLGEIYIRTTSLGENKPLNLFLVTEQDFTYKGLLYPKTIPSEQIIKNEDTVSNGDAEVARKNQEF